MSQGNSRRLLPSRARVSFETFGAVSAADHRELSEPWTGLVRFYELPKMLPDGKMVVHGRETRIQDTTRPDHILPEHWKI
eukprot:9478497-Pyramimonas_sp.AAC.1